MCDMVKLGDICSITKGKTGITKAILGKYPMAALSEERKSHHEYQFDKDAYGFSRRMPMHNATPQQPSHPPAIFELAEQMISLQKELVRQTLATYEPEVNAIILSRSQDEKRIELALTWMLDAAFDNTVLELFKKLCRYYYTMNPSATTDYIYHYREMWDEEYSQDDAQENEEMTPDCAIREVV